MAQQYFRVAGLEITAAEIDWPLDGEIQLTWQPPTLARRVDHYGLFHGESGVFLDPTTVQVGSVAAGPTPSFNYAAPTDGSDHFIWIIAFEDAAQNFGGSNKAMFGCQNNNFVQNGVISTGAAGLTIAVSPFTSNIGNGEGASTRSNLTGVITNVVPPAPPGGDQEMGLSLYLLDPPPSIRQVICLVPDTFVPPDAGNFDVTNAQDLDVNSVAPVFLEIDALGADYPGPQKNSTDVVAKVSYFAPADAEHGGGFFVPNEGDLAGAPFPSLIINPPPAIALPCVPYCNSTCALAMWPV